MVENINNLKLSIINLYSGNYLNQVHIRQMAKLIGKSHVTLLPYLREFEKSKILTSRAVGKSKVYTLNLGNNQAREFLSLAEKKRSLDLLSKELFIKKVYNEFSALNLAGCLILFGSYASETYSEESDIDLFYIGELSEGEKQEIKGVGKMYNKKIHLTSMSINQFKEQLIKQDSLVKEIISNHIILYNHDIFINEIWRYYGKKER